jgi:hypothetical protein
VDKLEILREIKRTAEENGGTPLGWRKFRTVTGISDSEWLGKHWARWSDAIAAAGLAPNEMTVAYDADHLLNLYAAYALELDRLPTAADLRLKRRKDVCYPDATVYQRLCTSLSSSNVWKRFVRLARSMFEYCNSAVNITKNSRIRKMRLEPPTIQLLLWDTSTYTNMEDKSSSRSAKLITP